MEPGSFLDFAFMAAIAFALGVSFYCSRDWRRDRRRSRRARVGRQVRSMEESDTQEAAG